MESVFNVLLGTGLALAYPFAQLMPKAHTTQIKTASVESSSNSDTPVQPMISPDKKSERANEKSKLDELMELYTQILQNGDQKEIIRVRYTIDLYVLAQQSCVREIPDLNSCEKFSYIIGCILKERAQKSKKYQMLGGRIDQHADEFKCAVRCIDMTITGNTFPHPKELSAFNNLRTWSYFKEDEWTKRRKHALKNIKHTYSQVLTQKTIK